MAILGGVKFYLSVAGFRQVLSSVGVRNYYYSGVRKANIAELY